MVAFRLNWSNGTLNLETNGHTHCKQSLLDCSWWPVPAPGASDTEWLHNLALIMEMQLLQKRVTVLWDDISSFIIKKVGR